MSISALSFFFYGLLFPFQVPLRPPWKSPWFRNHGGEQPHSNNGHQQRINPIGWQRLSNQGVAADSISTRHQHHWWSTSLQFPPLLWSSDSGASIWPTEVQVDNFEIYCLWYWICKEIDHCLFCSSQLLQISQWWFLFIWKREEFENSIERQRWKQDQRCNVWNVKKMKMQRKNVNNENKKWVTSVKSLCGWMIRLGGWGWWIRW